MEPQAFLSMARTTALAVTVDGRWKPGIGDPTFMGWATVIAYCIAGVLSLRALVQARRTEPAQAARKLVIFWAILAGLMLLLGINKQLDLQTWFTQTGRQLAIDGGWYQHRQEIKMIFFLSVAAASVCLIAFSAWLARGVLRQHLLALAGMVFTVFFVLMRATSFHHVDSVLRWRLAGIKANWILELTGILCVALSAWRAGRPSKPPGEPH